MSATCFYFHFILYICKYFFVYYTRCIDTPFIRDIHYYIFKYLFDNQFQVLFSLVLFCLLMIVQCLDFKSIKSLLLFLLSIHIDREFSNHDGTYVTIGCGFSNNTNYKRKIWDYKRANYLLMKQINIWNRLGQFNNWCMWYSWSGQYFWK